MIKALYLRQVKEKENNMFTDDQLLNASYRIGFFKDTKTTTGEIACHSLKVGDIIRQSIDLTNAYFELVTGIEEASGFSGYLLTTQYIYPDGTMQKEHTRRLYKNVSFEIVRIEEIEEIEARGELPMKYEEGFYFTYSSVDHDINNTLLNNDGYIESPELIKDLLYLWNCKYHNRYYFQSVTDIVDKTPSKIRSGSGMYIKDEFGIRYKVNEE